ncbi:hypothetical protein BD770DRAFT_392926 [Pilaira anomala]|nr:hypothetical protein BD770DRAFT_392926 [Pilaira anomala]
MLILRFTSIVSCISLLASSVHAYGMVAQVVDENNFCVFLPPDDSPNRIISDSEWNANAFCLGNTPLAKEAGTLPSGFIQSAHYVETEAYVQVTGQMDGSKADLDSTDGGGQMDIKAPDGSSCAGWSYYVNLIEPETNTYCMRCCNDSKSCNRGISEKGCAHIIPGDYSGPMDSSAEPTSSSSISEPSSSSSADGDGLISTTTHVAVASATTETIEDDDVSSSVTSEVVTSATSEIVASVTRSESASSVTSEPVSVSADAMTSSSTALPPISSSVSSSAAQQNTANPIPTEEATAQEVSGANINHPMKAVVGAGLFAFFTTFI